MKRILFFILLVALISGCGKEKSVEDNTDTSNYIRFKLDGQAIEYKDFVFATKDSIDDQYIIVIQGQKDASANVPGVGIFLTDTQQISKQTYGDDDGANTGNGILYSDEQAVDYSSLYMTEPSGLNVVITRIDSNFVNGTFSSKVSDLNGQTKTISEGVFQARIQ